jgi:hypothetical protein
MPENGQMTDSRSFPSSKSHSKAVFRQSTGAPRGSVTLHSNFFQSKSGLIQPDSPASLAGSTAVKGDFAIGINATTTGDLFESQVIDQISANTQSTTFTTSPSTFQEFPKHSEQGQQLQTDFGFNLPANKPFSDWMNSELLPSGMFVPIVSNLWDLQDVNNYVGRDVTTMEHMPWRYENCLN